MDLDPASPDPPLLREHLFGDLRPFSQCHASTLVELPDGRVLVAWFGGTREGHRDVAIWCAERERPLPMAGDAAERTREPGHGWSAPRVLARAADLLHWNPVLFAPTPGELALHFKVGPRIRDWETWLQRSRDAGRSWEAPEPLVPGDRGGRGAVRTKPIQLRSGDWLAGASVETRLRWDAFVDRSPDGIGGWTGSPWIPVDRGRMEGKGMIQPALYETADGGVRALLRTTAGRIYESRSDDDGRTWSMARPTGLPNNNSGLDVARLRDGTLALACNPVAGNWAARTPLSILLSGDEGRSWPERIDVESGPGEFSYPAVVELGAGLGLSYTWNRRRIVFVLVPRTAIPRPGRSGA